MRRYAAEARSKCGVSIANAGPGSRIIATDTLLVQPLAVPEPDIEAAWKEALSAGVHQLPARVKRNRTVDDSVTYLIELRRGNEYRAAEIEGRRAAGSGGRYAGQTGVRRRPPSPTATSRRGLPTVTRPRASSFARRGRPARRTLRVNGFFCGR
jgi:hypothetical protein